MTNIKENTSGQGQSQNREIKFRALIKGQHFKGFVYGYYVYSKKSDIHQIIDENGQIHYIDIDTLGQYIGLKDKNGIDIYEGDIIKDNVNDCLEIVIFKNGIFGSQSLDKTGRGAMFSEERCYEIVGNIDQNPELLSEK